MDVLPNEIILHILMYLSYSDILHLSYISRKIYCLCNSCSDFKKLCVNVWILYGNKKDFNSEIKKCRINIHNNIANLFKMFKRKHYLSALLMKKLEASNENLNPVSVFIHLINCNQKCILCTRFYVYSKSTIVLLKNTTMISKLITIDSNINELFQDIKKTFFIKQVILLIIVQSVLILENVLKNPLINLLLFIS